MELQLEELKAPIKVHFVDGVPHPIMAQVKEVPLQLKNWRGFHLGWNGLCFGNGVHHPKQCAHRRAQ